VEGAVPAGAQDDAAEVLKTFPTKLDRVPWIKTFPDLELESGF
jgi:hypothetical protein